MKRIGTIIAVTMLNSEGLAALSNALIGTGATNTTTNANLQTRGLVDYSHATNDRVFAPAFVACSFLFRINLVACLEISQKRYSLVLAQLSHNSRWRKIASLN
jgi:hypothetical protein